MRTDVGSIGDEDPREWLRVGATVRVSRGPLRDFSGTIDEIDWDDAKLRVEVLVFGRETPVELDFLQVERL